MFKPKNKIKKIIPIILLIIATNSFGNINKDSLWSIWNDESQLDTNRLKAIKTICYNDYLFTQPDSAYYYANLMLVLAKKSEHSKFASQALNMQGVSMYVQGKYILAIE